MVNLDNILKGQKFPGWKIKLFLIFSLSSQQKVLREIFAFKVIFKSGMWL